MQHANHWQTVIMTQLALPLVSFYPLPTLRHISPSLPSKYTRLLVNLSRWRTGEYQNFEKWTSAEFEALKSLSNNANPTALSFETAKFSVIE
jgi:hypothetical protein